MLRTALASTLFALLSYAAAHWLTHDWQVWTAEGARRLEVARHPVAAPPIVMEGPGLAATPLATLLADGRSVTVVDFMYTRCVSVCVALGSAFQQMQAAIRDDAGAAGAARDATTNASPVRLLSISFDAVHDSPAVLRRYAAGLQADPRVWRFVRVADAGETQRLLARYQVIVIPDGLGGWEHNAALLVIDPAGRLLRIFDYAELDTAMAFARWVGGPGMKP